MHVGKNKRKMLFILRSLKTHLKGNKPQMIKISTKNPENENSRCESKEKKFLGRNFCPYQIIQYYITIRPRYHDPNEQFFIFRDYSPVTALHMTSTLYLMLKLMNYNELLYDCHSFKIGRSCDLMKYGLSVETINKLGRWKLNIVYSYLR